MRIRIHKFHRHKRILLVIGVLLFYWAFFRSSSENSEILSDEHIVDKIQDAEIKVENKLNEHEHHDHVRVNPHENREHIRDKVVQEHAAHEAPVAQVKNQNKVKERVNIFNYVKPAPCASCPGENGAAVPIMPQEEAAVNQVMKKEFLNSLASERVSLWRSLPDVRFEECKQIIYPKDLPTVSVVIPFINERFSVLVRTIYSVIHESPKHLLKEIILVDDQSDLIELKGRLESYLDKTFGDIVKLYRSPKRLGLIAAKNHGAKRATGEVLVFFDAHCEAGKGWLEPLLIRIKENSTTVVCPIINSIDHKTLEYMGGLGPVMHGGFSWSMFFTWEKMPKRVVERRKSDAASYPSAAMAGGLMAVNRKFFFDLGGYDDGMEIWGGENLEMSFKTWMCGGSLEFVPCSNVGHIFRDGHPYNMTGEQGGGDVHGRNSMRLVETWLDDYKRLYYYYRPDLKGKNYGDISSRLAIKDRMKCKNFKWYLQHVYPDKFIIDEYVKAYGDIRVVNTDKCLDTMGVPEGYNKPVGLYNCQNGASVLQIFSYTNRHLIRREESCTFAHSDHSEIMLRHCLAFPDELWSHTRNGFIMNSFTNLCLDATNIEINGHPVMNECDEKNPNQKWQFSNYVHDDD